MNKAIAILSTISFLNICALAVGGYIFNETLYKHKINIETVRYNAIQNDLSDFDSLLHLEQLRWYRDNCPTQIKYMWEQGSCDSDWSKQVNSEETVAGVIQLMAENSKNRYWEKMALKWH